MEGQKEEVKDLQALKPVLDDLTGFIGIRPDRAVFVTPRAFKNKFPNDRSQWPVFKIKAMDGLELNQQIDDDSLYAWSEQIKRYVIQPGLFRMSRLRASLLGWRNFKDADGAEIPFQKGEDGKITDDAIRCLPMPLQIWLTNEIEAAASVTPEEREGLKF